MLIPAGSGDKLREKEDKEHEYKKNPASLIKRSGVLFLCSVSSYFSHQPRCKCEKEHQDGRLVHLVDSSSQAGNLAGSSILVKYSLALSLSDCGSCCGQCLCSCSLVASLYSGANLLDCSLNAGLDSLVGLSLLGAGENSLLGRFDVCHLYITSI